MKFCNCRNKEKNSTSFLEEREGRGEERERGRERERKKERERERERRERAYKETRIQLHSIFTSQMLDDKEATYSDIQIFRGSILNLEFKIIYSAYILRVHICAILFLKMYVHMVQKSK